MGMQQKVVKGVAWSALQSWGSQLITLLVFLLLARLLKPEDFGLVALAGVFISFLYVLQDQGFGQAIVQRQDLEPEHLDTAFWTNLGVGAVTTSICLIAAAPVAQLFHEPQLTPVLRWLSLNFLLSSLNAVQQAILRRNFSFKSLTIRTLMATLLSGAVGIVMAFMGYGVWSLVGQQLTRQLTGVAFLWKVTDWYPKFRFSKRHFDDLFSFGINITGISALNFFNTRSDDFLIGYFLGSVSLGYYSVAYRLPVMMQQILNSTRTIVTVPAFSRLQQEPERVRRGFYKATQLTSIFTYPAFFGLSVLAPEVVRGLFGQQWEQSISVLRVLAFVGLLQSVQGFNSQVITALGKPHWNLRIGFLNSLTNVLGFAIAVRWGITAVAGAFLISNYLFAPVRFWLLRKLAGIEAGVYFRQFVAPLLSSIVMASVLLAVKPFLSNLLGVHALLAVCIAIGALVYGLMILLTAPKTAGQLWEIARMALPKFLRPKKDLEKAADKQK